MSEATKYPKARNVRPLQGKHLERSRVNMAAAAGIRDSGMRGPNRPSLYEPGMLDKVCDALIAGESLTQLCNDPDMPSEASVYRAMAKDDEVARIIARARECQQDAEIDRTVAMADAATEADYNVVKLRIWARQWRASKLAPKKYGDRSDLNVTTQTIDVADRITKRWKENLTKLNELEPLPPRVIEGGKVDAPPSAR